MLRRCQGYWQQHGQLESRIYFARDALGRCTRSADVQGHGGGGDKMGELVARIDMLERRLLALEEAHNREILEAAALCGRMENAAAARFMYGTMVEGYTMRQMMGELKIDSYDTAKYLKRVGYAALEEMVSALGDDEEYMRLLDKADR